MDAKHTTDMQSTDSHMDMDMHNMYFHTGHEKHVLFYNWHAQSPGAMLGACCGIFAASVLLEGLKYLRDLLYLKATANTAQSDTELRSLINGLTEETFSSSISSGRHLTQTVLHVIQAILSYCLMLVFMTFNLWLCLALVLGIGLGYFLFGWKRVHAVDRNEQCH
ncbi:high affinity copper uptake protein 1 [Plakobranchus ocellatus]|uniref:Copper transport protein n=1 Tax=Plakobranchus ocellatus TaxID=259542 RepID=A0AAV3ZFA3_9GAST|nr:high affinity copper uptake protein 1 [Plakobranchus ocellatus]